ncbi:YveK family protein [Paenibacillus senegalensis]|uniref:YveK family protein n=1 Tax=Paenibacillus senegalensis TaxID=1465766 RepID=UPI000289827A|nr:Wzz/FepE/Etk N-terminal domain-containing protein [Paenibacillus senegalensis]
MNNIYPLLFAIENKTEQTEVNPLELKQYWYIVRKRLWLVVLLIITACLAAGVYSFYLVQPKYQASTKLIVNQARDSTQMAAPVDMNSISSNIQLVKTYKEIIRTPRIMDKVVDRFPELKATSGELMEKVNVSSVNDTQVMSLTAVDHSYERAAQIVNAVSVVFQEEIPLLFAIDNVSLLNEADPLRTAPPVSPNPALNLTVAFLLALLLGIGCAFLLEYLDDTIKTEEDIAAVLQLPTLSVIPKIQNSDLLEPKAKAASEAVRRGKNVTIET